MILVLDTETTGLPANYKAPVSGVENWPRAVQIAWATYKNDGTFIEGNSYIIKPKGYEIPAESTAIHGITTEMASAQGFEIGTVLACLESGIYQADHIVAHNIDFDAAIIGAEFIRAGMPNTIEFAPMICTMRASTEFCAIPGKYSGYKWPNLNELHVKLFDESIMAQHSADADAATCAKCFFELVKRGVIELAPEQEQEPEPEMADPDEIQDAIERENIFSPVELHAMTIRAYREQDQTRMTLHHAEYTLWQAQQRIDYLYGNNEEYAHPVEVAKVDALGSRLDFERARDEVERVRTLLRIAELAAGIART